MAPGTRKRGKPPDLPDKKDEAAEIRFDLGLGGLFKELGGFLDLASRLSEQGDREITRTGEVSGLGKTRAMYGFSVKVGLGGTPVVERFGNVVDPHRGKVVEDVREPLVDVFDEGEELLVVAELPGVREDEIEVSVKGETASISAGKKERRYAKEVALPAPAVSGSVKTSYKNGILEVRMKKAGK